MSKIRIRRRKQKNKHAKPRVIPVRNMAPNLVTLLSAASGITSIRFSFQGQWRAAVIAVIVSCVLDGLDGRVARMLRATSKLGAELDSLSDFASFGIAPALLVYFWLMETLPPGSPLHQYRGFLWAFALFYAMCSAFRLARFNIMIDDGLTAPYWKHFFVGLPAPGAAGLLLTPVVAQLHTGADFFRSPLLGSAMLIACGTLMASRMPTPSIKSLRVPARLMAPFLIVLIFIIGMLVSQFWLTLCALGTFYLCAIPVSWLAYLRLKKRHLALTAGAS